MICLGKKGFTKVKRYQKKEGSYETSGRTP
jgi:hypothetical protein